MAESEKDIVLFGDGNFASLAWYCLTHDSPYNVVGFTLDEEYLQETVRHGVPVVPFEALEQHFDPGQVKLLICIGYRGLNGLRKARYLEAKQRGYEFISYVSSRAHTWSNVPIGENCMIFEQSIIQPYARIGNNVILRTGVDISHHVLINDHCFIAAQSAIAGASEIGERVFLGLGARVTDNLSIAEGGLIAAGAVVTQNTQAYSIYRGSPAKHFQGSPEDFLS